MTPARAQTWSPRLAAPTMALVAFLAALSTRAAGADTLFGLIDTGELYASVDGGAHWSFRSALPARDAVALAAGTTSAELFLATESGFVHCSVDAGMTWTAVGSVPASDVAA